MKYSIVSIAAALSTVLLAAPALADDHREPDRGRELIAHGTLTTSVVPCSSLCTESEWTGTLDGLSSFSLISLTDEQVPGENISQFHGNLALSTAHGELIGTDLGTWNLDSGAYVDVYTVSSGTDDMDGATGVILLFGTLDPVSGAGFSHYDGIITLRPDRHDQGDHGDHCEHGRR